MLHQSLVVLILCIALVFDFDDVDRWISFHTTYIDKGSMMMLGFATRLCSDRYPSGEAVLLSTSPSRMLHVFTGICTSLGYAL